MCHADNEKWENINRKRNRTAKSRKNQDAWRERKLQVIRNIGSGHHQSSGNEGILKNLYLRRTRKLFKTKALRQKFHQSDKCIGSSICKILRTILKTDKNEN